MSSRICSMALLLVLGLCACSDRDSVVVYKQGKYQGKADTQPWANAPFNGDQAAWVNALRVRNQKQDESRRTGG